MIISTRVVHLAALALDTKGDIKQTAFEHAYRCRVGPMNPDIVNSYDIYFNTEQDATMFLLKWGA